MGRKEERRRWKGWTKPSSGWELTVVFLSRLENPFTSSCCCAPRKTFAACKTLLAQDWDIQIFFVFISIFTRVLRFPVKFPLRESVVEESIALLFRRYAWQAKRGKKNNKEIRRETSRGVENCFLWDRKQINSQSAKGGKKRGINRKGSKLIPLQSAWEFLSRAIY